MKTDGTKARSKTTAEAIPTDRTYDTLKRASTALRVSMAALKRLKNSGHPSMRGGRVRPGEFPEGWLDANVGVPDPMEALETRKLVAQVASLEARTQKINDELWTEDEVGELMWALLGPVKQWMQNMISECPVVLNGMTVDQIRSELEKRCNECLANVRAVSRGANITER